MPKNATRPSQDKHENGAYLFPEIDDPAFEEAMTSAIAKIMAGSSDLSKAAPGEQLEYLTPGEKAPGDTPVRTTQRGARGYYPSEVVGGEEEAAAPREAEPTEEREIEVVQAPEAKPELSPPFGSTLVEGYADRRIVPRTPKSEGGGPPTHLYRVMDKRQYDDAVKEGELKPAPEEFGGDRRIHAAGKPNFQYADPKPTVLVAIEYSDDDGWAARQAGFGDITAATYNPIPISKVTVLAEGANGRELRDNYNLITDAKPKSEYQMPKHDFSFDAYLASDKDRKTSLYRKEDYSAEDWEKMWGLRRKTIGDDDDLVQVVATSGVIHFIGAKDEEDLEENKKAFVWNQYFYDIKRNDRDEIVNAYNPPRIGEAPSWANDTDNALPDIPTDTIHIDDIPGWSRTYKYGGALKVNVGGEAGELIKDAGNVSGVLTRVFTPSVLKKLKLIDDLPENGESDFRATQFGQTSKTLKTMTDEAKLKAARQFRQATRKSLEHRNLPEKFYVYRGGAIHKGLLTRGKEEQERIANTSQDLLDIVPTSVSFDVNLAAGPEYTGTAPQYYDAGVGEEEAVLTMYEVSREDVLLDMPALFHGQTEQELIILPKNLKNPRKVVLPKIPKYYPAELGEDKLQQWDEKARKAGQWERGFMGGDVRKSNDDSIRIGNLNIPIEVATDPASGLSGRDRLAPSTGMLFIFDKSPVITMKGMKFPLDIVWMADNKVVDLTENALVPVLDSASLYTPKKHATTALEINGGEAQTLGIKIGDSVEDAGSIQSNLSKLLVLETALEYFIKAEAGEQLEYLSPGEKAPGDTRIHTTARGARGYYPSEVAGGEEEAEAQSELEPEEEREIEAVQAPAAEPPGLVQERERQGEQKKLLDALDVISPKMIKESRATNVVTLKGAKSIAQKQGLLNSNGVNEENLLENAMRVRPKYNKVGQRVITVWHGTTAAGAKGIIEDGRINAAQTGGPSGSGFNLSPTAARSWAGGKAIGREVKGLDSMPVVLQFDIRLGQLRDAVGDQQEDSYTVSPHSTVDYIDVQHMNLKIVYSEAEGGWPTTNLNLLDQQYTGIPRELLQDATITTGRLYSQEDVKKIVQKQMTFSSQIKQHPNPAVKPAIDRMLASAIKGLDGEGEDKAFADGLRDIPSWQIDRLNGMHIDWAVDSESDTIAAAVQPINGLMTVYRMGQMLKGTAQDRKIRGEYLRGVLVHELAHTIASPQGNGIPTSFIVDMEHEFQKAVEAEDGFVSTYSSTNPAEFFAECYKAYITATDTLRDVNPSMFEMMEKLNQADSIDSMSRPFTEEDFTTKGVYEKHSLVRQWQTTGQSQFTSLFHALSNAMNEVAHDKKWIAAWGKEKLIQDSIKRNQGFLPDFRQRIENQIHHAIAVGDTKEELLRLLTHSESKVRGAYARQRQKEIDQIGTYYGGNTDISSALLKFVRRTINQAVEKSPYYGKSEPWLSAYGQKDKITAEEEQQWGQFFQQEQLLQKQSVRKRSKIVKKAADFLSSFVIKDPEEVGEPITRESARLANKKFRDKKRNLSKFLVLETAVEYLAKIESGKREYLAPGEKAPEGLKEHPGSRPGVRYYVPGEAKPKQEFPSMHTMPSDVPIQPEFTGEEREIEAVSPGPDFAYGPGGRIETRQDTLSEDDYREQFAAMSNDLEEVLSSINPEHKQFLGTPFDDSKLIGDNLEYVAFTDGSFEGSIRPSGSGIHSEYNFTVFIEGKPFIYKIVPGENRAEHLSYSIDRALGLDVVPYIKPYNMDIDKLHKVFQKSQVAGQGDRPPQLIDQYTIEEAKDRVAAKGWGDIAAAGHFMEFCETCPDSEESAELIADMLTTTEGREEFFKLMLLDYVSGNDDRHSGNWLVTKDKKALAIDNGFGGEGGYAPLDETINRNVGRIGYSMKLGFPWRVQNALKAHFMDSGVEYNQIQGHLTRIQDPEMLGEEADNTFDKYYNLEKIQKALAPINWDAQSVWPNIDDAREAFRNHAVKWMIRGSGGKAEGDYSSEVLDESSNRLEQEQIAAIQARLGVSPPESGGFLNRIRNWIRLGGPDPKSSAPSSREFHPEFEGDTPPSQRGGPQQGRRGRN